MKLIVSEPVRKTMGIGILATMIAGGYPPLAGTTIGVALLLTSAVLWFPFLSVTYISNDLMVTITGLAGIAAIVFVVMGVPWLLLHLAEKCETGQYSALVFMATMIYCGVLYLSARVLIKKRSQ